MLVVDDAAILRRKMVNFAHDSAAPHGSSTLIAKPLVARARLTHRPLHNPALQPINCEQSSAS